ncbi:MAG: cob(I)yrinic acid a,c-diamide adenosyltransferase [Thermodesulfobacteriota bacterium]
MEFSKKGDQGFTSLLGGERISKADPRPEAYGTIDEASSALGLARAIATRNRTQTIIISLQKDLQILAAELATGAIEKTAQPYCIEATHVQRLENLIADLQKDVNLPRGFILPGKTLSSAAIDLARSIIRRAERRAVLLYQEKIIDNPQILAFLNRLADLLFTLARYEEA